MAVKDTHKFAIVISYAQGSISMGFDNLADVIRLIEGQVEISDPSKILSVVQEAIEEEVTVDGVTYNVLDAITYFDLYESDEDEDDE